jgi:hypothetical protein
MVAAKVRPLALLALLATAGTGRAQIADHLKCYKIKDPLKIIGRADLDTPQLGLDPGCKITSAKLFCVPSTKTNVAVVDKTTKQPITPLSIVGPDPGDRICYKVKCEQPVADQEVTDQFGTRTVTKLKAWVVCTPAVKGVPTSTSTSTSSTTSTSVCTPTPCPPCRRVPFPDGCGGFCPANCAFNCCEEPQGCTPAVCF